MPPFSWLRLSRRERQIMDVIYRLGEASAHDVHAQLPDPPSYSSVRSALSILAEKDHVRFERRGRSYIYRPAVPQTAARTDAARRLLATFFKGSVPLAVGELLNASERGLSDDDLDAIAVLVEDARKNRASDSSETPDEA